MQYFHLLLWSCVNICSSKHVLFLLNTSNSISKYQSIMDNRKISGIFVPSNPIIYLWNWLDPESWICCYACQQSARSLPLSHVEIFDMNYLPWQKSISFCVLLTFNRWLQINCIRQFCTADISISSPIFCLN